jgi:hypothetical protein
MRRTVVWFSCGAASAVAAHMTLQSTPDAILAYCATRSEHEDNERFRLDCQRWLNRGVTVLSSQEFQDTWHVWEKERYLSGINGAPCTRALKFRPRLEFQRPDDIHVFGYTADASDRKRADALRENYPEMTIETPLIEAGATKANVLALIEAVGIKLPVLYGLGFHNNNCMPCVKAQSPAYWALVRKHFPLQFYRLATLARKLGVRLTRVGKEWCRLDAKAVYGERQFIDEIPMGHSTTNPIVPACDFLCPAMEPAE